MYSFSYRRDQGGFDWGEFISGILMVVVGLLLLKHPEKGLHAFVLIFGVVSLVQGVAWIAAYFRFKQFFDWSWTAFIPGVLDIIIGILFLVYDDVGGLTLAYLFAVWFLADSIVGIAFSWHLKVFQPGYFIFSLIMNILSLLIAISLIFNPILAALSMIWLVAFWLLVFGVNQIILAWMHR
ncbi:integral membrane protein [Lactobacillus pasteurii DSM 23907 = CRBIP 24.76]|uniref:Integral membrane protein n=1 Tax=Lactobacillus pasteurii DSM 23907 = CRBIP 24.76 TaxID=1423790 RepID=I7JYX5_9LACO|nr:DUF308 domain-containing protein [Lactobacillus pasteurii]KRK08799.1 integral membrane protein [Lactobacillus pasteurii DSM 23907 = CRBIP 24.76]TDG76366.1 hypothetical protein C5L33_001125 [Lactobacillus pasteurii]CCI85910.1 Integral membrane protein [Lactobacillus pasteurii DSM 23907 = CRBIP 24.76]